MNFHQPVLPTTTIVIPNVLVLETQAMNPSISHTTIHVNRYLYYGTNYQVIQKS